MASIVLDERELAGLARSIAEHLAMISEPEEPLRLELPTEIFRPTLRPPTSLTPQETRVLGVLITGASNTEAGRILGISPRTVEVHRDRVMEKMEARSPAHLGWLAARMGFTPTGAP